VPILVGWRIGEAKGRAVVGILLAVLLGWIGVIALALVGVLDELRLLHELDEEVTQLTRPVGAAPELPPKAATSATGSALVNLPAPQ
jgi:hypothetical protein